MLHIYIMKKWYGEALYVVMKENDYIIAVISSPENWTTNSLFLFEDILTI